MEDITDKLYVVCSGGTLHELSKWTGNSRRLVIVASSDGDPYSVPIPAGETNWAVIEMTWHQAITPGWYAITGQFVDDLARYATEQYAL